MAYSSQSMSASQATPSLNLQCLVKIEFIIPDWEHWSDNRHNRHDWVPPIRPLDYRQNGATPWLRWFPGRLARVADGEIADSEPEYDSCSLFYDAERDLFLGVPFDCRKRSVLREMQDHQSRAYGWRRLSFEHNTYNGRNLSVLKFDDEHSVLCAPGSPSWIPELVPRSYNHNISVSGPPECDGPTVVAGKLALIFGFVAFSCETENLFEVIQRSLRPPRWVPHGLEYERGCALDETFVIDSDER